MLRLIHKLNMAVIHVWKKENLSVCKWLGKLSSPVSFSADFIRISNSFSRLSKISEVSQAVLLVFHKTNELLPMNKFSLCFNGKREHRVETTLQI